MQPKDKFLIIVGGPTASGKTDFAIRLAKHFKTAIISSDSRQFFKEMNIGTAKPTADELKAAPHLLVDHLSIHDSYSIGAFEREALAHLDRIYQDHSVAILAGGSGMYIKALCEGLDAFPEVPTSIKEEVQWLYEEKGLAALQREVSLVDPNYFEQVDQDNPHRLMRALAVFRASGQPFSSFRTGNKTTRNFWPIHIWLDWPRDQLYARINQRVDQMVANGLVAEARELYPLRDLVPLQTVGYQELFAAFDGNHSIDTAVDLIKRNSRRYAKRQLTWSRRDGFWKHFGAQEFDWSLVYLELAMKYRWQFETNELEKGTKVLSLASEDGYCSIQFLKKKHQTRLLKFESTGYPDQVIDFFVHEIKRRLAFSLSPKEIPENLKKYF